MLFVVDLRERASFLATQVKHCGVYVHHNAPALGLDPDKADRQFRTRRGVHAGIAEFAEGLFGIHGPKTRPKTGRKTPTRQTPASIKPAAMTERPTAAEASLQLIL